MANAVVKSTILEQVTKARDQIALVLPRHIDVDRVITGVRLALAQNKGLAECEPKTVLFAVMAASRIGLEINGPLQECWLIPYKTECTLQIGYRGFQGLARRGGDIRSIEARLVFEGDHFDVQYGTDPRIDHKPNGETDPAKLTHVYAVAFDKAGKSFAFDVLTREDVERARKSSRMANGGAWKDHTGEMWRKTAVRRLAKYLPLSPDLAAAIELDLRGETGEVSAPIPGIDTDETLNQGLAVKTKDRLEEIKGELGKGAPPAPTAANVGEGSTDGQPF